MKINDGEKSKIFRKSLMISIYRCDFFYVRGHTQTKTEGNQFPRTEEKFISGGFLFTFLCADANFGHLNVV